jgi:hypothetical protein
MLQRLGLSIPWNEQKRRAGFVVAWHLPCPFNLSIQSVRHLSFRINTLQQKKNAVSPANYTGSRPCTKI